MIFRGAETERRGEVCSKTGKNQSQASFAENLADIEGYGRTKGLRSISSSSTPGRFKRILQEAQCYSNIAAARCPVFTGISRSERERVDNGHVH